MTPPAVLALPLRLPYPRASTIEDAAGRIIAECPDEHTALALLALANSAITAAEQIAYYRQALGLANQDEPEK